MAKHPLGEGEGLPIAFHGKATEYFGIFIVNVLLTALTLGLYGPWAKVRAKKYFYGNTELDGEPFSYRAKGSQILLGRLAIYGVLLVAAILSAVFPPFIAVLYIGLFFVLPWLVGRAFQFNARVSVWRGASFNFSSPYWTSFVIFYGTPIMAFGSGGLLAPVASKFVQEWALGRHTFAGRPFTLQFPVAKAYGLVLLLVLIFAAFMAGLVSLMAALGGFSGMGAVQLFGEDSVAVNHGSIALVYGALALVLGLNLMYRAGVRNLAFSALELDGQHKLHSNVSMMRYVFIIFTNAIVVALTLGLMLPWARIRKARFIASGTMVIPGGPLDAFLAEAIAAQEAIGEEYVEIEGIDIGVGL